MKKLTRAFSLLLAIVLLCGVMPYVEVSADSTYIVNGVSVRADDFSSKKNDCWNYAQNVYKKIWGVGFSNSFGENSNMLRNLSTEELTLTEEHLREYVSHAELGSVLRVCDYEYLYGSDGWGHSQVIVSKDANGFTVFEGGLSSSPYRREHYYTWSEYINTNWLGKYDYIKYIKWPGAPEYCGVIDKAYPSYCQIDVTVESTLMSMPCSEKTDVASTPIRKVSKGEKLTAIALIMNIAGNYWYQIKTEDGSRAYIPASKTNFVSAVTDDVVFQNEVVPSQITKGSSFALGGVVSTKYNHLSYVCGYVSKKVLPAGIIYTGYKDDVDTKNYSLRGSLVDKNCTFGILDVGNYYFAIEASLFGYYAVDAKTHKTYDKPVFVYSTQFTVVDKPQACSHNYVMSSQVDANCYSEGSTTYTCTKCGASYSEPIPADHSFGGWYTLIAPTCVDDGIDARSCSACGYEEIRVVDALGHAYYIFSEGTPDCGNNGWVTYVCDNCGELEYVDLPATGEHIFSHRFLPATCIQFYSHESVCNICGYSETIILDYNYADHTYEVTTVEPTCTSAGYQKYTCTVCGDTYTETVSTTNHQLSCWHSENNYFAMESGWWSRECKCGANKERFYVDITYTNGSYWANIETVYGYLLGIEDVNGVINGEDATICTTQEAFAASNANWANVIYAQLQNDGTYIVLGIERGSGSMDNFNFSFGDGQIAVVVHSASTSPEDTFTYLNWLDLLVAGELNVGDILVLDGIDLQAGTCTNGKILIQEPTPVCTNHDYRRTGKISATCTENGLYTYTCSNCGDVWTQEVAAFGHSWEIEDVAPTCTEYGWTQMYCTFCGVCEANVIHDPVGHNYTSQATDATCLTDGKTVYTCTVCSDTCTETIPATGHSYVDGTCTNCGDVIVTDYGVEISLTEAKALAGETVTVDILLDKNAGFTYLNLYVNYDKEALELVSVANGAIVDTFMQGVSMIWATANNATETGVLATLTFAVKENVAAGDYVIDVMMLECCDEKEQDVNVKVTDGTLTVVDFVYGDCNGDQKVNGKDVTRLLQYLANVDPFSGTSTIEISLGADCTGDGKINGKDVTRLLQYLANVDPFTGESSVVLGK